MSHNITYPASIIKPTEVIIASGAGVSTFSNLSLQLDSGVGGVVSNVLSTGLTVDATGFSQSYLKSNHLSLGGANGSASLICEASTNVLKTTSHFQCGAIVDSTGSSGSSGQWLTSGAGENQWNALPIPTLQEVVVSGATISNGTAISFDQTGATSLVDLQLQMSNDATFTRSVLNDNTLTFDFPNSSVPLVSSVLSAGSLIYTNEVGITNQIIIDASGNLECGSFQPSSIVDGYSSAGTSGQYLTASSVGGSLAWTTLPAPPDTPSIQAVVNAGNQITNGTAIQWSLAGAETTLTNQELEMSGGTHDTNITLSSQQQGLFLTNSTNTTQMTLNKTSLHFVDPSGNLTISQTANKLTLTTPEQAPIDATFSKYWPVVINGTSYIVPLFIPT